MDIRNILQSIHPPRGEEELFDTLLERKDLHIERIISRGQTTPLGEWYDTVKNEWVVLLQGKATLEMEKGKTLHLSRGDSVFIPAREKHRVSYTSINPYCIWLAIHFD